MTQPARPGTATTSGFDPRWLPLIVTSIGSFMSILDSTIVNIALSRILHEFHANLQRGQLVITVYLVALAIVIPLTGFLGERVGMKRLYLITVMLFTVGSALCGFAWNLQSLIAFRILQGLGGGMLQPLGMAIVFSMITPIERGRFMGVLGLPVLLAPILGPTVGGYLVQYSSWRAIFMINVPIGLLNLGLGYLLLQETPRRLAARLDVRGVTLAAIAFPCILVGMSEGDSAGWTSPGVLALLGIGVVALVLFVRTELRQSDPLLQVRLFAHPMFRLALTMQFVLQFSLFGLQFLLPLFFQQAHGWSPVRTGLVMFPSGILSFITLNVSGRLYNWLGPRVLSVSGLLVLGVTTLLLSRATLDTSIGMLTVLASGRGLALGLCMMPTQTVAYNTVPAGQIPRATGMVNVSMRIFGSASTAVLTSILISSLALRGAPAGASVTAGTVPLPLLVRAFDDAFFVMTGLCMVGILLAWRVRDPVLEALKLRDAHAEEALVPASESKLAPAD